MSTENITHTLLLVREQKNNLEFSGQDQILGMSEVLYFLEYTFGNVYSLLEPLVSSLISVNMIDSETDWVKSGNESKAQQKML